MGFVSFIALFDGCSRMQPFVRVPPLPFLAARYDAILCARTCGVGRWSMTRRCAKPDEWTVLRSGRFAGATTERERDTRRPRRKTASPNPAATEPHPQARVGSRIRDAVAFREAVEHLVDDKILDKPDRRKEYTAVYPASRAVQRAFHATSATVQHVRVDHGCAHVVVPEELLNRADVVAAFEEMRREGVAERMA
jgi:hypothetical protein